MKRWTSLPERVAVRQRLPRPGLRCLAMVLAAAINTPAAEPAPSRPLVSLNHAYFTVAPELFTDIRESSALDSLAAHAERTSTADSGETWSRFYLYGRRTYLEIFAATPQQPAGTCGVAFGVELSGTLSALQLARADGSPVRSSIHYPITRSIRMRVGLFIPCYVDQFYPDVGLATAELLEQVGCEVDFPVEQTCCGQPMANTGCWEEARPLALRFLKIFEPYDAIVCPSGSCVAMVTHHYDDLVSGREGFQEIKRKTYELTQFLTDVRPLTSLPGVRFPYRVGLHNSCHGLRELRLGSDSERMLPTFSKARQLLQLVEGLELVELSRPDECCGFGGTFAVSEEAVSCMMGLDRLADHERAGAQVITAGDMSCLMHLEGLLKRQHKPQTVMHIAQILAGRQPQN